MKSEGGMKVISVVTKVEWEGYESYSIYVIEDQSDEANPIYIKVGCQKHSLHHWYKHYKDIIYNNHSVSEYRVVCAEEYEYYHNHRYDLGDDIEAKREWARRNNDERAQIRETQLRTRRVAMEGMPKLIEAIAKQHGINLGMAYDEITNRAAEALLKQDIYKPYNYRLDLPYGGDSNSLYNTQYYDKLLDARRKVIEEERMEMCYYLEEDASEGREEDEQVCIADGND